jgi:hypothetical protein
LRYYLTKNKKNMKKIISTVAIIALFATTAFAQNVNTLRGSVGLGYANPSGAGGGFGALAGALGVAGLVSGVVALADDDDVRKPCSVGAPPAR